MPTVQQFVKVIEKQLLSTGTAKLKSVSNDMFNEIADAISKKYIVKIDYDNKEIELAQDDKENEEEVDVENDDEEEVEVDVENEVVNNNENNDKVNDNKQEKEYNNKENVDANVHNNNEVVEDKGNNTTLQSNTQNLNMEVHNNEYSDKMRMVEDEKADERAMIILKREYSEPLKKKYNADSLTTVIKTMIKNELKQMGIEYHEESKKRFTKTEIVKIGDLL
jgi:hypothetical protein